MGATNEKDIDLWKVRSQSWISTENADWLLRCP